MIISFWHIYILLCLLQYINILHLTGKITYKLAYFSWYITKNIYLHFPIPKYKCYNENNIDNYCSEWLIL